MITTLALLHRDKLQRIHDAPPDSTTGLLQQVRTLSAASGWERGKTWKEWEGIGRIGKNMKTTNSWSFLLLLHPQHSTITFSVDKVARLTETFPEVLNFLVVPTRLRRHTGPSGPYSSLTCHGRPLALAVSQWCWGSMLLVGSCRIS